MTLPSAEPATPGGGPTAVGAVVGGRFQIEHAVGEDALGAVLAAKDQKTSKPIALRMLPKALLEGAAASEALRAGVRTAAALPHKNLVTAFGAGLDPKAGWYVASEWVEAQQLSEIVAFRAANDLGGTSLRGAVDVTQQLCAALTAAHVKTVHGGVRPSVVWVAKNGRVKLGDLGITRALLKSAGAQAFGPTEQPWLAPEVKTGAAPDPKSDVFGIGALLYAMLTGRSPSDEFLPPSKSHPDASVALDQVLLACLDPDPGNRFETPDEVSAALARLSADAPPAAHNDFTGETDAHDFDIDVGSMRPRATAAAAATPAFPKPPAAPRMPGPPAPPDGRPKVGQRVAAGEQFRASLPNPPGAPVAPAPKDTAATAAAPPAEVDLGSLLAKITENDAPRWMVVKDNLDHGPFSGRELVQSILKGEVLDTHGLLNMDTGERRKVREFPEFVEFLEQYTLRKNEADEKVALERSETVQKAGNAAKLLVALAVLGVVGLIAGIFIVTRQGKSSERVADSNLADLYERGQINITGTAGILPPPPRGSGRRGGGRGGGGGGGMSYEEAMNQAVNLGDVSRGGGGERQLTPGDVAGVMNRNLNSLFSCVSAELRSGGSLSNVQIDLAIAGSGQVLGASSRQGSASFKNCIGNRARGIRFPTFPAPRMGARYSFSVD
jgi:hypothetical protein